ncbi:hypothetical protein Mapa_017437 [Marchantia paleacea]|nr:hypothetical protein Mapa_017437 [Marchantia paleacea]
MRLVQFHHGERESLQMVHDVIGSSLQNGRVGLVMLIARRPAHSQVYSFLKRDDVLRLLRIGVSRCSRLLACCYRSSQWCRSQETGELALQVAHAVEQALGRARGFALPGQITSARGDDGIDARCFG